MELKKSYKGLVLWLAGYLAVCFLPLCFVSETTTESFYMRYILNATAIAMAVLTGIILKTEAVYWYNGTDYESAVKAGSERRKEFARKHFDVFFWFAVLFLLLTVLTVVLKVSYWVDFAVGTVGICAAAISTVRFKL